MALKKKNQQFPPRRFIYTKKKQSFVHAANIALTSVNYASMKTTHLYKMDNFKNVVFSSTASGKHLAKVCDQVIRRVQMSQ